MTQLDYDDVFGEPGLEKVGRFPDLHGKAVFITGGGSGIGAFLTAGFALQGAKVAFVSLRREPAELLCDAIAERAPHKPLAIQADIRDVAALQAAIEQAAVAHDGLDVLVNNAARDTRHTLEELTPDFWDDSIATNLRPQMFAAQSAAAHFRAAGGGVIINVGSNSFELGLAGYPAYVTAKAGIVGLTKALARELGPEKIRVNVLVPGWVLTERQKRLWASEEDVAYCLEEQSLKETIGGWDMVGPTLFLASSASAMMTGQELVVDGGRT